MLAQDTKSTQQILQDGESYKEASPVQPQEPLAPQNKETHQNEILSPESDEEEDQECSDQSSVSYEDEILDDHQNAVELFLLELEHQFEHSECILLGREKQQKPLLKLLTFQLQLKAMFQGLNNAKPQKLANFKEFLFREKSFGDFLKHLHYRYEDQRSEEFIKLGFVVWELYFPCYRMSLSQAELEKVGRDISTKLCNIRAILPLSKDGLQAQEQSLMRQKFLAFFTQTIVFVIEGIFKNPYSCERRCIGLKRARNDFPGQEQPENESGSQCRKKIKTRWL